MVFFIFSRLAADARTEIDAPPKPPAVEAVQEPIDDVLENWPFTDPTDDEPVVFAASQEIDTLQVEPIADVAAEEMDVELATADVAGPASFHPAPVGDVVAEAEEQEVAPQRSVPQPMVPLPTPANLAEYAEQLRAACDAASQQFQAMDAPQQIAFGIAATTLLVVAVFILMRPRTAAPAIAEPAAIGTPDAHKKIMVGDSEASTPTLSCTRSGRKIPRELLAGEAPPLFISSAVVR